MSDRRCSAALCAALTVLALGIVPRGAAAEIFDCNLKPVPPVIGYVLDHYRVNLDRKTGTIVVTSNACDCDEVLKVTESRVAEDTDRSVTFAWKSVQRSKSGKTYHFSERLVIQKASGKARMTLRTVGKSKIEARGTCTVR